MYQFKKGLNSTHFFWWEKKLIENMNWALLPKSSKAVFPVIACHCNQKGEAFPGERTIAILAGVSDKVARAGIRGMETFPGFKWENYITRRGKRSKKFFLNLPAYVRGRVFPFYRFILEAGLWRELKPSAKALYPVMRFFGFFDLELYDEIEFGEPDSNLIDFREIYMDREYDICEADMSILAQYAGVHRNSVATALANLEHNCLIEPIGLQYGWKVFLKSKDCRSFKRSYLNEKVMSSYRYALERTNTTGNGNQSLPKNAQIKDEQ